MCIRDRSKFTDVSGSFKWAANSVDFMYGNGLVTVSYTHLIDDIVTTGATLAECSRVLRTAGASDVVYAAFAAPRKQD